jgi:hypothetical protein
MSRAFIKDGDDQWLSDISPTLNALIYFLTRENNGVRVQVKREKLGADGKTQYEMSNGLTYMVGADGKWMVV